MVSKSIPTTPPTTPPNHLPLPQDEDRPAPPRRTIDYFDMRVVLNIYRSDDHCVREVVSLHDLLLPGGGGGDDDGSARLPSWDALLEILRHATVDGRAVFDADRDMMLFDECLCVRDERQFLAAMQWIANEEMASRNVNVPVHGSDSDARRRLWAKG